MAKTPTENLPWVTLNKLNLDDKFLWEVYKKFDEADAYIIRDNRGTYKDITKVVALDQTIKTQELLNYKRETLDKIALNIFKEFDLPIVNHVACFMETKENGILQWHTDEGGPLGKPVAGLLYSLNDLGDRGPTSFMYNNKKEVLNNYKCAIIHTGVPHMVDNTGFGRRYSYRITLYGPTFEEIRDKINLIKERNHGKYD